jgi:hypothetical protein
MSRLPWQPDPEHQGFIAYPDGEDKPHRFAMIWYDVSLPSDGEQWRWCATITAPAPEDRPFHFATRYGLAMNKQAAADRATEAWPVVVAEAAVKGI